MKIEHIAIWTRDLEKMRQFYVDFFDLKSNQKYHNPVKQFSSYFLSFENGPRIELMYSPDIADVLKAINTGPGLAHFAVSVGSESRVDQLTQRLWEGGYEVIGQPRTTGDGYYESVIADPEGNLIEITV